MLHTAAPLPHDRPPHYLEQAAWLHALHHEQGMTLAELSRLTGWPVPVLVDRMALSGLDEGLRARLTEEGAPEGVARALLRLPDEVSRRRIARRILRDRLCVRDAALLVDAALHRLGGTAEPPAPPQHKARPIPHGRVITLVRDRRPYVNAIRDIAQQMQSAGVRATLTEQRNGGQLALTVTLYTRRRRMDRYQSM